MIDNSRGDEVARYLDDVMRPADRERFESRMSRDAALRDVVNAERAIRATIAREIAALPTEHASARAAMMAALAELPATPPTDAPQPPAHPPGPVSPLLRWLGAAGAGAVLIVSGYLLLDRGDRTIDRAPAARSVSSARADSTAGARAVAPGAAPLEASGASDRTSITDTQPARAGTQPPRASADGAATTAKAPAKSSPDADVATARPVAPAPRKLKVIDRDSVRVRVGVEEVRTRP